MRRTENFQRRASHRFGVAPLVDGHLARPSVSLALLFIRQQAVQHFGQRGWVVGRHQAPAASRLQQFGECTVTRFHHGHPCRQGLQHKQALRFAVSRRDREHVELPEELDLSAAVQFACVTENVRCTRRPQFGELGLRVRAMAFSEPAGNAKLTGFHTGFLAEFQEGVHQHVQALLRSQPGQVADAWRTWRARRQFGCGRTKIASLDA
jgi:hypothetical protein